MSDVMTPQPNGAGVCWHGLFSQLQELLQQQMQRGSMRASKFQQAW
jgi:hypothetical protein